MGGWQGSEGATSFFLWKNPSILALGSSAVLREPGQGGPGSSPGLGLSPQPPGKTMAVEAWSRRGLAGKGGTQRTHARPHPSRSPARSGGHTGRAPLGTRSEESPSPNWTLPQHTPPTGAGQLQPKREKRRGEKRIKSTMKRHNKHQLYPKSGAASFQQTSGCRGAALLLRTPIINLGEGGVGGTFPPSFPFVPLPRSAPLLAKSCRGSRRRPRGALPAAAAEQLRGGGRGRTGRGKEGGSERALWRAGGGVQRCGAPAARPPGPRAGHGAHTYTYFMYIIDIRTHAHTRGMKLSSPQEDAGALSSPDTREKLALGSVFSSTRPLRKKKKKRKSKPSHPFGAGAANRSGSPLSSPQPLSSRIAPSPQRTAPFWVRGFLWDPLRQPSPAAPLGSAGSPRTPRSAGAHLQRAHTNPLLEESCPPSPNSTSLACADSLAERRGWSWGWFSSNFGGCFFPASLRDFFKPPPQQGWRQQSSAEHPRTRAALPARNI